MKKLVFALGLLSFPFSVAANEPEEKEACDSFLVSDNFLPIKLVPPVYPIKANEKEIEGSVIVAFTVMEDGSTADVELVEETPKNQGFGRAAIKAAYKIEYAPVIVNGEPVKVECVAYTYIFQIN